MQTPGVEPDAEDGVEPELDELQDEPEAEEAEGVDLGDEDAEEPEGDEEPAAAEPAQQRRRPGREERRRAEVRELRERLERQDRELATVRGQIQQPRVDPAEQARRDQAEREQVMLYPPEQQIAYWRDRDRREIAQVLQSQQLQFGEHLDKQGWESACRSDAVRQRFADRVEATLASERQAGRNPQRETVFQYLYGGEALKQRQRKAEPQRKAANARVRGQTTQPGGGRSDVQRERAPAGDSYEAALKRISGRPIW